MARKYYLAIDGDKVFDINNLWLPPTTSAIVELSAGKHAIEVQGERNDKPVLYWRPVSEETVFRSPVAQTLDYTVFAGNGDEVIASYRELTGPSPMMPLWSLGYIHCRERYNTQAELLENAREFRQRKLPIAMMALFKIGNIGGNMVGMRCGLMKTGILIRGKCFRSFMIWIYA